MNDLPNPSPVCSQTYEDDFRQLAGSSCSVQTRRDSQGPSGAAQNGVSSSTSMSTTCHASFKKAWAMDRGAACAEITRNRILVTQDTQVHHHPQTKRRFLTYPMQAASEVWCSTMGSEIATALLSLFEKLPGTPGAVSNTSGFASRPTVVRVVSWRGGVPCDVEQHEPRKGFCGKCHVEDASHSSSIGVWKP